MSGGTFDYDQFKIGKIADDIQNHLDRQGKLKDDVNDVYRRDFYAEYPEAKFYEIYQSEVQEAMKAGINALKIAEVYAHRIDYFLAGDDGDENFLKRLQDELNEIK